MTIVSPEGVIFDGKAQSVICPGENGVFEVLAFHKRLLSRLLGGRIFVNGKPLAIRRGVVKVGLDRTLILVEQERGAVPVES